ncbi:hypothetical protein JB92DRAFT_2929969 [Gautieria morchelliformis]|nr:hypothetical protein JB92DRAFT_2929969 [Gautieria morchelliformis]
MSMDVFRSGNLACIKALERPIAIVNSPAVADQGLFERRSSNCSDRYDFPTLGDLYGTLFLFWRPLCSSHHLLVHGVGFTWRFLVLCYGDRWRFMFHPKFHPIAAAAYHSVQAKIHINVR